MQAFKKLIKQNVDIVNSVLTDDEKLKYDDLYVVAVHTTNTELIEYCLNVYGDKADTYKKYTLIQLVCDVDLYCWYMSRNCNHKIRYTPGVVIDVFTRATALRVDDTSDDMIVKYHTSFINYITKDIYTDDAVNAYAKYVEHLIVDVRCLKLVQHVLETIDKCYIKSIASSVQSVLGKVRNPAILRYVLNKCKIGVTFGLMMDIIQSNSWDISVDCFNCLLENMTIDNERTYVFPHNMSYSYTTQIITKLLSIKSINDKLNIVIE